MNRIAKGLVACAVAAAVCFPALPAIPLSVRIDGATQGWIQGEDPRSMVEGAEFHHLVSTPAGSTTPRHDVAILTKNVDKASVKLWRAYGTGERLQVKLHYYRIDDTGTEVNFYTVTLTDARIVGLEPILPHGKDPALERMVPMERVRFEYRSMTVKWELAPADSYTMTVG